MSVSIKPLEVPCPTCHVPAGRRCVVPSRKQTRAPHPERRRARFAGQPEVVAAISAFDWAHYLKEATHRLLDQDGDAEADLADAPPAPRPIAEVRAA